jgi:hypothetical protein
VKLGDGLVVGFHVARQPDKRQIVMRFSLQLAENENPIGITVDQQLEHNLGIVLRTTGFAGILFVCPTAHDPANPRTHHKLESLFITNQSPSRQEKSLDYALEHPSNRTLPWPS